MPFNRMIRVGSSGCPPYRHAIDTLCWQSGSFPPALSLEDSGRPPGGALSLSAAAAALSDLTDDRHLIETIIESRRDAISRSSADAALPEAAAPLMTTAPPTLPATSFAEALSQATAARAAAARPQSACVLYVGWSAVHSTVGCVLLRLNGDSGLWCTPGGFLDDSESPEAAALREFGEELLGLEGVDALLHGAQLLSLATSDNWYGPFGDTTRHCAFLATDIAGDIDQLVANFVPNSEIAAAALVPLELLDGTGTSFVFADGSPLYLRNKIGYLRFQFACTIAISLPPNASPTPSVASTEAMDVDTPDPQRAVEASPSIELTASVEHRGMSLTEVVSVLLSATLSDDSDRWWVFERRRKGTPYQGLYGGFGGKIEATESRAQALTRELYQEAGVSLITESMIHVDTTETDDWRVHTHLAAWHNGIPFGKEHQTIMWLTAGEILNLGVSCFTLPTWNALQAVFAMHLTLDVPSVRADEALADSIRRHSLVGSVASSSAPSALDIKPRVSRHVSANPPLSITVGSETLGLDTIWQPSATSVEKRAAANRVFVVDAHVAHRSPLKYSLAPSLAPCLGQSLLAARHIDVSNLPGVMLPPKPRLPPAIPQAAEWRPMSDRLCSFIGPLYEREFRFPLPDDFEWPNITHWAFHEDTGALREAFRHRRGRMSASVADRPTMMPPSSECYHFIAQVYDVVQAVARAGLVIEGQANHVECGRASWSAWQLWPENILNGSMLEAGEELLWVNCIGLRSLGEQPHTAHECVVGPPTFVTNANMHGDYDKTWCIYARHVDEMEPTAIVPEGQRISILAKAHGSREVKMLKRSGTPKLMAQAMADAIDGCSLPVLDHERAANQPCAQYFAMRRALHHNYGILSASFAPTLDDAVVVNALSARTLPCAIIVPLAATAAGPRVLIPLRNAGVFGVILDGDASTYKQTVEDACRFVSIDIESQFMHALNNDTNDFVVAVPWDREPVVCALTPAEIVQAHDSNVPAIWCSLDALALHCAFEAASFAIQRMVAMGGAVSSDYLNVGIWKHARPAQPRRRAAQYTTAPDAPDAERQWLAFLAEEELRKPVMVADLIAADKGTGLTAGIALQVKTAADHASELPMPPQGLPSFSDPQLLLIAAPQRPPPVIAAWLARLPPQALPPGFKKLPWTDAIRPFGRRLIVDSKNDSMKYDAYCTRYGRPPDHLRRGDVVVLGKGAGYEIQHADGIGTYNILDIMLETDLADGLLDSLDFQKPDARTWLFDAIKAHIGTTDNQRMLSFLFHGVCWMVDAPTQIRVQRNLARFDNNALAGNEKLRKLEAKGYLKIVKICPVAVGLSVDGPNPFLRLPEWQTPIGFLMKSNGTARVVGDMTAPHGDVRERNRPHGEPDGPICVSLNDLSGPKGRIKEGYTGPAPMPDPEIKPRPRHLYAAACYLSYYASVLGSFLVNLDDDMVDMFFQFFVRAPDQALNVWNSTMEFDGEMWLVSMLVFVMNQGWRNASKVACEFAEEWTDGWRRVMDAFVVDWLTRQSPAFIAAYNTRRDALGHAQARPFWAGVYTDNWSVTFASSELAAAGTFLWKDMNKAALIELQPFVQYGTCNTWIGGRYVLSGGFGTIVPSKRERAANACELALINSLTREMYASNIAFLPHVADICDWPRDVLEDIGGPLKIPGFDHDSIIMTPNATKRNRECIELLRNRPLASFWSGVNDACVDWTGSGAAAKLIRVHATDACTDPQPCPGNPNPQPHIAGMVDGVYWRYKIDADLLDEHITLTEAIGPAISHVQTVPMFPHDINVLGSDATAALAMAAGTARAPKLRALRRVVKEEPGFAERDATCWLNHWKGWGNGIVDALSRDDLHKAFRIAHAFGIRLTEMPLNDAAKRLLHRLRVRIRHKPADAFLVHIIGVNGDKCSLSTAPPLSIASIVEEYLVEAFMDVDLVKLSVIKEGRSLPLDDSVQDCGVRANDTLQIRFLAVGGSPTGSAGCSSSHMHGTPSTPLVAAVFAALHGGSLTDRDIIWWLNSLLHGFDAPTSHITATSRNAIYFIIMCILRGNDLTTCWLPTKLVSEEKFCLWAPAILELSYVQGLMGLMEVNSRAFNEISESDASFQISVFGVNGEYKFMYTSPFEFIFALVDRFFALCKQPPLDVYIVMGGKSLDANHSMRQANVTPHNALSLRWRARSGMRASEEPPTPMRVGRRASRAASAPPASPSFQAVASRLAQPVGVRPTISIMRAVPYTPPIDPPLPVPRSYVSTMGVAPLPLLPVRRSCSSPTRVHPSGMRAAPAAVSSTAARSGSPQALTADAARRQAANDTAAYLTSNTTEYTLCGGDPELLSNFIAQISAAQARGIPKGTLASDRWSWKWAVTFGQATNTRWVTPRVNSPDIDITLERWRAALLLFWMSQHMNPSPKRRALGFDAAKPTSPLLAIYGWMRVLRSCERYVTDLVQVHPLLKGLCQTYKELWGDDAFAVIQAALFNRPMLLAIAARCADYGVPDWDTILHDVWQSLHKFLLSTGTRKDEFSCDFDGDDFIKRSNFVWLDASFNRLDMTPSVISCRSDGDLLEGTSGASKCDRLNVTWRKQKQYFRLDTSDPLNFAHAFQRYELKYPCPMAERSTWPAFSPRGDKTHFTSSTASRQHRALCISSLGFAAAVERTIHSYRASFVTALYKRRAEGHAHLTDPIMQAHVRWKTLEAMMSYAKIGPNQFADNIALATSADPGLERPDDLPVVEPTATLDSIESSMRIIIGTPSSPKPVPPSAPATLTAPKPQPPSSKALVTPPPSSNSTSITLVGHVRPVLAYNTDTWHLIGTNVDLPNELWDEHDGSRSSCAIVHLLTRHAFARGGSHPAYVVSIDGFDGLYAIKASTIATHVDATRRARLRKQPNPRPL